MSVTAIVLTLMVLAALGAVGCVVATRPRQPAAVLSAVIMLVAMLDMAAGHLLLTAGAWAVVLIASGVFVVALPGSAACHDWQHGLALVAAAVIMIGSPHALPSTSASGTLDATTHAGHAVSVSLSGGWLLGVGIVAAYVLVAGAPVLQRTGRSRRTELTQVIGTTACLALMAAVPIVTQHVA